MDETELTELRAEVERLKREVPRLMAQRDDAQAEVERLRAAVAEALDCLKQPSDEGHCIADCDNDAWQAADVLATALVRHKCR